MDIKTRADALRRIEVLEKRAADWHKAAKTPRKYFTTRREATHRALKAEQEAASVRAALQGLAE